VTLYAVRSAEETARQHQSLLRALSSHWRLPFGRLESGWLKLMAVEDYRSAVADTPAVAAPASCAEAPPPTPPPGGVDALAQRPDCRAEAAAWVFLTALSDDFARRSQHALARLRAVAC